MATFNFSVSTTKRTIKESNVVHKNIKGVVYINEQADYKVFYNDMFYNISEDSYFCKGKDKIYKQGYANELGQNLCVIRDADSKEEKHPLFYLPFGIGSVVIGNIVKDKDNYLVFKINETLMDCTNEECHKAKRFYAENYKAINKIILDKQKNVFR